MNTTKPTSPLETRFPELNRLLSWTIRSGPGLAMVEVNPVPLRNELMDWLETKTGEAGLKTHRLQLQPGDFNFSGQLDAGIKQAVDKACGVIFLYNFESLLPLNEEPQRDYIRGINFSREILKLAQVPVIFWLPEFLARLMQRYAPDFWDWRSVVFQFAEAQESKTLPETISATAGETIFTDWQARDKMIAILERQYQELAPEDKNKLQAADMLVSLAGLYHEKALYRQAIDCYEKALEIVKKFPDKEYQKGEILNGMGLTWNATGEYTKAIDFHTQALKVAEKLFMSHPDLLADCFTNLGVDCSNLGDFQKALGYYQKALEMWEKLYGNQPHPNLANYLNNFGVAWGKLRDFQKALDYHQKALEMWEKLYGSQPHPDLATSLNNLGYAWNNLGDFQKALDYHQKALEMREKLYGSRPHPKLANSFKALATVWDELGNYPKARDYYQKALEICQATLGNEHPHTKLVAASLAKLQDKLK